MSLVIYSHQLRMCGPPVTEEMFVSRLLVKIELENYVKHLVQKSASWGSITQYIVGFNMECWSKTHSLNHSQRPWCWDWVMQLEMAGQNWGRGEDKEGMSQHCGRSCLLPWFVCGQLKNLIENQNQHQKEVPFISLYDVPFFLCVCLQKAY